MLDLVKILAEGSMQATAAIAAAKGIRIEDYAALTEALRREVKASYAEVVREGREAIEAGMSEQFLRTQLNVSCNLIAARALTACALLPRAENVAG